MWSRRGIKELWERVDTVETTLTVVESQPEPEPEPEPEPVSALPLLGQLLLALGLLRLGVMRLSRRGAAGT